jgi:hypothetical protein
MAVFWEKSRAGIRPLWRAVKAVEADTDVDANLL